MLCSPAPHLAALEGWLRPALVRLPAGLAVRLYSRGRRTFVEAFAREMPKSTRQVPEGLSRTLWGIEFRSPLGNAAGIFKSGAGYGVVAAQGAGFYLAGTSTAGSRVGNRRHGVSTPFAPYPRSGAASNWLGLPNPGHRAMAGKLGQLSRSGKGGRAPGCPIGASLSADPQERSEERKLAGLVEGLECYAEAAVDFLEINESCPNTDDADASFDSLVERLRQVSEQFLAHRPRRLPVVVKFSNDTELDQVPHLLDVLLELGFDGVNFGNTSVDYGGLRPSILPAERPLYDHFVDRFGGGVSGRPLRARSLALVTAAAAYLSEVEAAQEFHIIRTGGVENGADVEESLRAGASLVQWYSGYFEAFSRQGHGVYSGLYENLGPALRKGGPDNGTASAGDRTAEPSSGKRSPSSRPA